MFISLNNKNLTQLPPLSSEIQVLYCGYNQLTNIFQVSFLNELQGLNCENNELTQLPSLPNTNQTLISLHFNDNLIQNINDLPNTLKYLSCNNNPLIHLPQLPQSLKEIWISPWQIGSCLNNLNNSKAVVYINN